MRRKKSPSLWTSLVLVFVKNEIDNAHRGDKDVQHTRNVSINQKVKSVSKLEKTVNYPRGKTVKVNKQNECV